MLSDMHISTARPYNPAKARLKAGGSIVAFGLTSSSIGMAQILARSGADLLIIDLEHACIGINDAQSLIAADLGPNCSCIVRLPAHTSALTKPILDAGAMGLTFPMIREARELAEAIRQSLYYPDGTRAIGHHTAPARWGLSAAQYLKEANNQLLFNVLIETQEAVADIEAIVKTEGLDIVTIGLGDLSASLGHPGDVDHPIVREAIAHVENAVLASPVALGGIVASPAEISAKRKRGYRMLVAGFDVSLLSIAATEVVKKCKS